MGHPPLCVILSFLPSIFPSFLPSVLPSFRPSVRHRWMWPNKTSKYHDFWYGYVKSEPLDGFFFVFWKFWVLHLLRHYKGQKMNQNRPKTPNALWIFFKLWSKARYKKKTKMTCLAFPEKFPSWTNGQFGPILEQNYVLHYLRTHFKDFFQTLHHK